jgi:glucosamine--fructose-6-phosphate aminotransferase (isomerizing)
MSGTIMAAEIGEQPAVLGRILQDGWPEIQRVAAAVRDRRPRFVLFVARGTSDHAAIYAKYLVETRLALPAGLTSPSTMTVYDARPAMQDVLVVAVSQSGASPDLVEPLVRARAGGAITVAITNTPGSPLATAAEFHLDVLAGPERAVAATKTYTAQLLTLYLFVAALAGEDRTEADGLPARARAILARDDEVARLAVRYRFAEQIVLTARGYNLPTALEAALKLMETSYLVCHAFSGADLLHGPLAMIDRGFPVVAIAPEGKGGDALRPVLEQVRERGADILVAGDPALVALGTVGLPLADLGPEALTPILAILPMQQLAWHLARERGSDPDQPRGLRKVTETW